ncbi:MAG: hypothetical protein Q9160_001990 [Pyrenula sp. 1 TL-2023]
MADEKGAITPPSNGDSHYENDSKDIVGVTRPQMRKLHDPSVTFEEYHYYARLTRAGEEQRHIESAAPKQGILKTIFPPKSSEATDAPNRNGSIDEKVLNINNAAQRMEISDDEWANASRAMRTATWAAIFYLITTDILGPFGVPWVLFFASCGRIV